MRDEPSSSWATNLRKRIRSTRHSKRRKPIPRPSRKSDRPQSPRRRRKRSKRREQLLSRVRHSAFLDSPKPWRRWLRGQLFSLSASQFFQLAFESPAVAAHPLRQLPKRYFAAFFFFARARRSVFLPRAARFFALVLPWLCPIMAQ